LLDDPDFRSLLDLSPAAAIVLQAERARPAPTIRLVNRAFAELAGLAPDALIGRSLRTLRSIVEPGEPFAALVDAARTGEPYAGRLRLRTPAGQTQAVAVRAQAMAQHPDRYVVWIDTGPVAAGLPARLAPGESARLLAALSDACFYELSVDVDCRLRLAWADSRLAELTGYEPDELLEMGGFFGLVVAADRDELHRRNQRLLTGQAAPVRYRLRRKEGDLRWVQDTARAERGAEAELVTRIVGTLANVTDAWTGLPPPPVLERLAALLADTAGACLFLVDLRGRIHWAGNRPSGLSGTGPQVQAGQPLAAFLPARLLVVWLRNIVGTRCVS
jgi:PAS domain S-box-containing protein